MPFADPEKRREAKRRWRENNRDYHRKYYAENRERIREQANKRAMANPRPWHKRREIVLRQYGLTLDDYNKLLQSQRGVCASCKKPEKLLSIKGEPVALCVDHCHTTGAVRALLCSGCNAALGHAQEDPEILRSLAAYIEQFNV